MTTPFDNAEFYASSQQEMKRLHLHGLSRDVAGILRGYGFDVTTSQPAHGEVTGPELAQFCLDERRTLVTGSTKTPDRFVNLKEYPPVIVIRRLTGSQRIADRVVSKIQEVTCQFSRLRPHAEIVTVTQEKRRRYKLRKAKRQRALEREERLAKRPLRQKPQPACHTAKPRETPLHLDECVSGVAFAASLRSRGFDVTTTRDAQLKRASDAKQLRYCEEQGRTLITSDTGIPAQRDAGPFRPPVVFVSHQHPEAMAENVIAKLRSQERKAS